MKTFDKTDRAAILAELAPFAEKYLRLMSYYRCAMMEVETKFRVISEDFTFRHDRNPIETVKSRLKSPESIRRKMEKLGSEVTVEGIESMINDVAGVRVICSFLDDVYALADSFLGQDDVRLISRKDYIKSPKENGYRSLHLIVEIPIFLFDEKRMMRVEIQLRTIAMDFWASLDHHMRYKKDGARITDDTRAELLRSATLSAELDESMNSLRVQILGE